MKLFSAFKKNAGYVRMYPEEQGIPMTCLDTEKKSVFTGADLDKQTLSFWGSKPEAASPIDCVSQDERDQTVNILATCVEAFLAANGLEKRTWLHLLRTLTSDETLNAMTSRDELQFAVRLKARETKPDSIIAILEQKKKLMQPRDPGVKIDNTSSYLLAHDFGAKIRRQIQLEIQAASKVAEQIEVILLAFTEKLAPAP